MFFIILTLVLTLFCSFANFIIWSSSSDRFGLRNKSMMGGVSSTTDSVSTLVCADSRLSCKQSSGVPK